MRSRVRSSPLLVRIPLAQVSTWCASIGRGSEPVNRKPKSTSSVTTIFEGYPTSLIQEVCSVSKVTACLWKKGSERRRNVPFGSSDFMYKVRSSRFSGADGASTARLENWYLQKVGGSTQDGFGRSKSCVGTVTFEGATWSFGTR